MSDIGSQPAINRPTEAGRSLRRRGFPVDVYESRDELHMMADMPGVSPDALDIRVERHELTIEGRRQDMDVHYHRVFSLPDRVDPDRVRAEYRHGVLDLVIPKISPAEPRRITVKSGD